MPISANSYTITLALVFKILYIALMLKVIRQSQRHLRLWLLATAAVLLLTAVIEAGHAHGIFVPDNDHCVLCQYSSVLDQAVPTTVNLIFTLLVVGYITSCVDRLIPSSTHLLTPIRAPPTHLHTR